MVTFSSGCCDSINAFQFSNPNLVPDHGVPGVLNASSQHQIVHNDMCDEEGNPVEGDYFDGVYDYIKRMLMEEDDLERRPCMFQDISALQAAEKYFYDALWEKDSTPMDGDGHDVGPPQAFGANHHQSFEVDHEHNPDSCNRSASGFAQWSVLDSQFCSESLRIEGSSTCNLNDFDCFQVLNTTAGRQNQAIFQLQVRNNIDSFLQVNECTNHGLGCGETNFNQAASGEGRGGKENSRKDESRGKKTNDQRDNDGFEESRNCKQLACCADDSEPLEKYDKSLLCPQMNPNFYRDPNDGRSDTSDEEDEGKKQYRKSTEAKRGRPKGSKKNGKAREVIDLRSLLTRCAQAVASFNNSAAQDLLKQIRQHTSPYGDPNERLGHCFANALEARLSGTGSALYTASASRRTTAAELLKSYQTYVTSCPFKRMSNILANKTIAKCTLEAPKIHIIDFGILYGFQWPCLIHGISLRPGGPPMLKITGIDFPQKGFKPAESVEQTGRRLMNCCKRFNVPFEYNAIAKKWDDISLEDLKIERDEMVVVNCMYRLRHVPDESTGVDSPRDEVLKLIKKINPELFVHGVLNGTYNAPFFTSRFREALHHYSSFFDILEATIPREDQDRLLYEREVFGRDSLNIIACEGSERIERPETYKQWQVRNQRAGFRQVAISPEILREVKIKVFKGYHKEFMVEEDGDWMLQGWKGRVMYALSFWKPTEQ